MPHKGNRPVIIEIIYTYTVKEMSILFYNIKKASELLARMFEHDILEYC